MTAVKSNYAKKRLNLSTCSRLALPFVGTIPQRSKQDTMTRRRGTAQLSAGELRNSIRPPKDASAPMGVGTVKVNTGLLPYGQTKPNQTKPNLRVVSTILEESVVSFNESIDVCNRRARGGRRTQRS